METGSKIDTALQAAAASQVQQFEAMLQRAGLFYSSAESRDYGPNDQPGRSAATGPYRVTFCVGDATITFDKTTGELVRIETLS